MIYQFGEHEYQEDSIGDHYEHVENDAVYYYTGYLSRKGPVAIHTSLTIFACEEAFIMAGGATWRHTDFTPFATIEHTHYD